MRTEKYRPLQRTVLSGVAVTLMFAAVKSGIAQCVDHPQGKTAVILKNETKHDLVFRIDETEKGMVPSKRSSREWEVMPGEHLLIAGAVIEGWAYWVWTENEVPKGQVCTWTVEDSIRQNPAVNQL
jgi:hypothetical protein